MTRCINLDWLECFVEELGEPHSADYFRSRGLWVQKREYGTRVYNEMFTLLDNENIPFLEVRRLPKNPLMPHSASHIRLVNRACYLDDAAAMMQHFIDTFDYRLQRISRVDICLDFAKFDDNTLPRIFMQRYMRGKFSKINQANIHCHGSDRWTGRVWNSVSWGSPSSQISTKFYNKTLELYDPKYDCYGKPHIRYSWLRAGLIDDFDRCTLRGETQEIWRVEFSIRSSVKNWFVIELKGKDRAYQSIRNNLDMYSTRERLLCLFASLSQHYFHFKKYLPDQRKDRCPDRILFRWNDTQLVVSPERTPQPSRKSPKELLHVINTIENVLEYYCPYDMRKQLEELLTIIRRIAMQYELNNPYSREQLLALQLLMKRRAAGQNDTMKSVMAEVKNALHLNDATLSL